MTRPRSPAPRLRSALFRGYSASAAEAAASPADHFSSTLPNFQNAIAPIQVSTNRPTIA